MQPSSGRWAVTPEGQEEIRRLMGDVDWLTLVNEDTTKEPLFAGAPHHLLPAELAPVRYQHGVAGFLGEHLFDRNIFLMSRFPAEKDSFDLDAAIKVCQGICTGHQMALHQASDAAFDDDLLANVGSYIWACRYGVALVEDREEEGVNLNMVLEVGAMLVTGRRCLLLKDTSVEKMPTDLVGQIYKPVDLEDPETVTAAVEDWLTADLRL